MTDNTDYDTWTRDSLITRVKELEEELKLSHKSIELIPKDSAEPASEAIDEAPKKEKKTKKKKTTIDASKYSTRFIALKIAYIGKNYNGFEYSQSATVPTIEEVLWKALVKSCLISPERPEEVNFNSLEEYSKCGRTDRGVSAFGQVIGIRVRSNRPIPKPPGATDDSHAETEAGDQQAQSEAGEPSKKKQKKPPKPVKPPGEWHHIADEIQYCRVLNRVLPPDIKVIAWCPSPPPGFSARFSCRERQYRYYFTQPGFAPVQSGVEGIDDSKNGVGNGWLDIEAMRDAAKRFEGLHDFRNFCKVDPGKQLSNFGRRMFESDIVEVKDVDSALDFLNHQGQAIDPGASFPKVYYFHVRGSAFLWHQIRCMVAILFAVGQGLESPSVVSELLDVEKYPRKPIYTMADEVPLVLWDCIFPKLDDASQLGNHHPDGFEGNQQDSIDWVWVGEDSPEHLHGRKGLVSHLWGQWREKKMDELLANRLLDFVSTRPDISRNLAGTSLPTKNPTSQLAFEGGNGARVAGTYTPLLERSTLPTPEEINDKWAQSKGLPAPRT
jgi:tRNA pseudouridine38/39 synthase